MLVEELADDQHGAGSQHTLDFAARAAYQQAIDTGHPDIAPHAAFNLERLGRGSSLSRRWPKPFQPISYVLERPAKLPLALLCAVIAWRTPLADGHSRSQ